LSFFQTFRPCRPSCWRGSRHVFYNAARRQKAPGVQSETGTLGQQESKSSNTPSTSPLSLFLSSRFLELDCRHLSRMIPSGTTDLEGKSQPSTFGSSPLFPNHHFFFMRALGIFAYRARSFSLESWLIASLFDPFSLVPWILRDIATDSDRLIRGRCICQGRVWVDPFTPDFLRFLRVVNWIYQS